MRALLSDWTVKRPSNWLQLVNRPLTEKERHKVQLSLKRSRPYGEESWIRETALELGMEHTLRSEGRPKSKEEDYDAKY